MGYSKKGGEYITRSPIRLLQYELRSVTKQTKPSQSKTTKHVFGSRGDHASPSQAQFLSQWGKNKVLRHTLRKEFPRKSMSAERKSVWHLVCEAVVPWSAEYMTRKMGNKETQAGKRLSNGWNGLHVSQV